MSDSFSICGHTFTSRLILGTGKYSSFEMMRQSLEASETQCVTIAVRREKLHDSTGRNILDFVDPQRYVFLPNTAGCYDAATAVRCAKMGREILRGLENQGADWVKLEVLGDSRSLLPDPIELLKATEILVKDGFKVLCYSSDDPIIARRLKDAGASSVMPAGSPIGSGLGVLNPNSLGIILDDLKRGDPEYPVIIDAGVGTASDVAIAMEMGFDAVLLNSAVARARDPARMSKAMKLGVEAGRLAFASGRIEKSRYASASSPELGVISTEVGK
ncbi:MAG: thiazole synthase [Planctomycetota bacterium]